MEKIELSFCIPTYNRVQSVYKLVTDILLCNDDSIEVIVLDNGSSDNTLGILRSIKDRRLAVYNNDENKGGLYNAVNVINKAKGKFLVFSTDKDHIDFNEIPKFKLFLLNHPDLASGYCAFNSKAEIEYEIFEQGFQAVRNIAYKGRHPTGYFFNNEFLKTISHVERFSDYKIVDVFPFEFIHAELCLMGKGGIYHGHMITLEAEEIAAKHKSYNPSGKKEVFFSPEARLKMAISYTKHISTLHLFRRERELLIIDVFFQQLSAATIGYQWVLRNKNICSHYYMNCSELNPKELFSIGLNFYKQYKSKTKILWGKSLISQMTFELYIFKRVFTNMICRLIGFFKRRIIGFFKLFRFPSLDDLK